MNFGEWPMKERWYCCWEMESICNRVMEDVRECISYWLDRWWQRRKQMFYGLVVVAYLVTSLPP